MRNRWTAFILTLLYGVLIIVGIGYITHQQALQATNAARLEQIPSIAEFQAKLNRLESYNLIVEDGILGKETQAKWDRVWMNQQAEQFFEGQIE